MVAWSVCIQAALTIYDFSSPPRNCRHCTPPGVRQLPFEFCLFDIHRILELLRDAGLNTLMWPVFVEEGDVLIKNMLQPAQAEDNEVIQALLSKTADPAFSKSIVVWCLQRCVDSFDASALQ